ncbi:hypothetical protein BDW59DRAFT_180548 [Aspergillus cavernicola]|uniref:Mitochondrial ATPase expression-domain-containing protein n=1 Tax=Aspergillus cavernicola TaxID=176166 RepID=A0ABR4IZ22_9EURO
MALRLSRSLLQANRRLCGALPLLTLSTVGHIVTRHNGGQHIQQWKYRPRVAQSNFTRYSHTDSANVNEPAIKFSVHTEQHWKSQTLPIVDRLIEPQTVGHFLEYTTHGALPNGKQTTLPLLSPDEIQLLLIPSAEWAPAPFNTNTVSTIHQTSVRIGSYEDDARLSIIGKNIHSLKNRLWEGLAPLSASRWTEKDLSNPDRFDTACEYVTAVIAVFEYLNFEQIQSSMRDTFNLISGHLQDADSALNARRAAQGQGQPQLSLTGLWEEFMRAKYEMITAAAHSWVLSRIAELQRPLLDEFSHLPDGQKIDMFTERWQQLLEITSEADFKIWIPMDGYYGYHPSSQVVPGLRNPNLDTLRKTHRDRFQTTIFSRLEQYIQNQDPDTIQSPRVRRERISISTTVQDELRTEIRGPSSPSESYSEPWIQMLLWLQKATLESGPNREFGLAVYRSTSSTVTDEQWRTMRQKLETHLSAWGADNNLQTSQIKPLLKLHWIDDDANIHDTQAAKNHFLENRHSDTYKNKLHPSIFLAVDTWSYTSYMDPKNLHPFTNHHQKSQPSLLPGDFTPHILAIDADFDPTCPPERPDESPNYPGHLRILGNLVWSELYAMLVLQSATLEDLWPLAMEHPLKVYTGVTVPSQRGVWIERNIQTRELLKPFLESVREKREYDAAVKHMEEFMMPFVPGRTDT